MRNEDLCRARIILTKLGWFRSRRGAKKHGRSWQKELFLEVKHVAIM